MGNHGANPLRSPGKKRGIIDISKISIGNRDESGVFVLGRSSNPRILGEDALAPERLYQKMFRLTANKVEHTGISEVTMVTMN